MDNNYMDLNDEEKLTFQRKLYRLCTNECATFKHFKDLDRLDSILVKAGHDIELREKTNVNITSFISEGVIICKFDEVHKTKYLYFSSTFYESNYELHIERYERGNDFGFIWYYTINVQVPYYTDIDKMDDIHKSTNILLTSDAYIDQFAKKHLKDLSLGELELIDRKRHTTDEILPSINRDISAILGIFACTNFLYENCNRIYINGKNKRNNPDINDQTEKNQRKSKEKSKEIIINDNIVIKTYNCILENNLFRNKRSFCTSSWSVRGHQRHYKNGKTVYIKPYSKGKSRDGLTQSRKTTFIVDI